MDQGIYDLEWAIGNGGSPRSAAIGPVNEANLGRVMVLDEAVRKTQT
jgi:hypothetical protein